MSVFIVCAISEGVAENDWFFFSVGLHVICGVVYERRSSLSLGIYYDEFKLPICIVLYSSLQISKTENPYPSRPIRLLLSTIC